jgi:uncharacterized protein YegP (UPF0339 family)
VKFEIHKNNDNQYWFGLKTVNGENIGKSKGYLVKQSAKKGIKSVRAKSPIGAFSAFIFTDSIPVSASCLEV